ncbi:hypothetical protein F1536_29045 [Achromobacter xylosoxidans]|uniref:hypothetical protein n=1 Tax=Alcaligenes xylosoxydans xylosoxydans TaxID=85698 RepID=UPI001232EF37|nr:hypothetical protein [Achromobacter xylosoxidans]KAA5918995.1 hypothetical protein F1536_29045 [Achromobacter xylosoxidans]
MVASEKTEASNSNNRWWESYLVRYFLGFVVGAICIAAIVIYSGLVPGALFVANEASRVVSNEPKYGMTSIVVAVAVLGLAYCYVASTPITVLHAGRYSKGAADRLSRFFWFGWVLVLSILMFIPQLAKFRFSCGLVSYAAAFVISGVLIALWRFDKGEGATCAGNAVVDRSNAIVPESGAVDYRNRDYLLIFPFFCAIWSFSQFIPLYFGVEPQISDIRLLVIGAPVVWIGLAQYFVLFKIFNGSKDNYEFYKKLFAARRKAGARDVRDTYSHLREHSNAIFIVAVEISMLALVLGGMRIDRAGAPTSHWDSVTFWLSALGIWIVPTIFMWSRANAMERYFSENSEQFLAEENQAARSDPHNVSGI